MVHSHYTFEIRQARSHLFLIRHPRPGYFKKRSWKDCNEFEQEISKIESFPEIISRIDEYVAQLKEEVAYLKIAKAIVEERARIRSIKRAEARKVLENLRQTLLGEMRKRKADEDL
ncbi:hypothetical protein AtNW77_Chr3g0177481 [Arabidopsis thaliana]|uniref:Uncharacterized protein n=2 Tax=Arabidopsis thaliana TaxID=3702 RepID=Q9LJ58_ARATH|nr:unnamed protein product [Arabidopsis thaliana]CAD5323502.1 unnamed protein product [Arabidopsis thaliana]